MRQDREVLSIAHLNAFFTEPGRSAHRLHRASPPFLCRSTSTKDKQAPLKLNGYFSLAISALSYFESFKGYWPSKTIWTMSHSKCIALAEFSWAQWADFWKFQLRHLLSDAEPQPPGHTGMLYWANWGLSQFAPGWTPSSHYNECCLSCLSLFFRSAGWEENK